jgi:myosin heavy subunit
MKYIIPLFAALFLISCENHKERAEQLEQKVDSLQSVTIQRDSVIEVFREDFSAIQASLDSIRRLERMMPGSGESESRLSGNQRNQIINDIETINTLLEENEELIASMKRRLGASNVQSDKLQSMIEEMETQSKELQQKLQQRDTEVGELTQMVKEQRQNIDLLQQQITEATEFSAMQADSLKMRTTALNRAYYTVAPLKELRDEGIVEREGGILGIGSTPTMRSDFVHENFTPVDIRELEFIPLESRKADLISVHPNESYHISGNNQADTLYIEDPELFWAASKFLVVAVK